MAKFCTYCGKPLPEDGVCDCELSAAARAAAAQQAEAAAAPAEEPAPSAPAGEGGAQAAPAAPAAENVYVKKTKAAVSQSVPFVKEYWKNPIQATRRVLQENNMALAIVMIVVNALITGLLVFACLAKLAGGIKAGFKAMGGLFGDSMRVSVAAPFFPSLFYGILMAVIALALSVLILFLLLKIFKVNLKFSYLVITVGGTSVFCSAILVLAILFSVFGWVVPVLFCLVLGAVVWGVLGILLLTKLFGVPISGLLVTLASVFFALVIAVNCWLGSKLSLQALGQVEIEDTKISEALEELEDMDPEEIIEQFTGSMMNSFFYGF